MKTHQRRRCGLALVDVLVVLAVLVLLLGGVFPAAQRRAASSSNRGRCASNLRQIGLAIQMYANDNQGRFPRTIDTPDDPDPALTFFTAPYAVKPFAPGGPAANDVTAALFLVLRTQDLTSDVFVCPSDRSASPLVSLGPPMSNFPGRQNLSYSYIVPYLSAQARKSGLKLDFTLSAEFGLAADMNPGGSGLTSLKPDAPRSDQWQGNSPNHDGDGQNVLYADGHVEYQETSFCGMARTLSDGSQFRDNIFYSGGPGTPSPAAVLAAPQDAKDSILLPVAPEGPTNAATLIRDAAESRRKLILVAGGTLALGALAIGVIKLMGRAGKKGDPRSADPGGPSAAAP